MCLIDSNRSVNSSMYSNGAIVLLSCAMRLMYWMNPNVWVRWSITPSWSEYTVNMPWSLPNLSADLKFRLKYSPAFFRMCLQVWPNEYKSFSGKYSNISSMQSTFSLKIGGDGGGDGGGCSINIWTSSSCGAVSWFVVWCVTSHILLHNLPRVFDTRNGLKSFLRRSIGFLRENEWNKCTN